MEIVGRLPETLTIRMTSDERGSIRQTFALYVGGVSAVALFRGLHVPHFASVNLESFIDKYDLQQSINNVSPTAAMLGAKAIKDENVRVDITLDIQEWAAILFVLNVMVYGCVVSEHDLRVVTGFPRDMIAATMVSLHKSIERDVYRIAAAESIRLKRVRKKSDM